MPARLKVFVSSDGLTEHVVAASSRAKALAAWGAHQDLFKTGGARETDDPDLVRAALAKPGEVLQRATDTPDLPKAVVPKPVRRRAPIRRRGPSKADLQRVARAEARLAAIEAAHDTARARLEAARAKLEADMQAESARFEAVRAKARCALDEAQARLDR